MAQELFGKDLVEFVDNRIAFKQRNDIAKGVCLEDMAANSVTCLVQFDGSSASVIVKTMERTVRQGDRVGLIKLGTEWTVFGVFGKQSFPTQTSWQTLSAGSTTSFTFVDIPGWSAFTFVKQFDATNFVVDINLTCFFTSANNTRYAVSPVYSGVYTNGTSGDLIFYANVLNQHLTFSSKRKWTLPAGSYQVGMQWRRSTGTGFIQSDGEDHMDVSIKEEWP